jgi:16S rRNA processing protein RimM
MLSIETGGREALVPFVWPIVVRVDREARRIVLDPPEGLLEL